jgi:hypothetical protein
MRRCVVAIVFAALGLTACGGDSGGTPKATDRTTTSVAAGQTETVAPTVPDDPANSTVAPEPIDSTIPVAVGSGDGDSEFCAQAQELSDSDAFSGNLPSTQAQIDAAQQGLVAVATVAPVELKPSVDTLANFYREFGPQLLLISAPATTDPAQAAAAVQALAILQPQFETVRPAIEQVSTYLRTRCGLAGG